MNKRGVLISVIFILVFVGAVSASVSVGKPAYSIPNQYSQGQAITGWVNLSVTDEPYDSNLTEINSGQSISIQKILSTQSSSIYQCTPSTCEEGYSVSGAGENSMKFHLDAGQSKTIGILINGGTVSSVGGLSFNVTSSATESDSPQLNISLFNKSSAVWKSYVGSGSFSGLHYGCYNPGASNLKAFTVYTTPYCETINIPTSPELNIGAFVSGSGSDSLSMVIYDASDLNHEGSCTLQVTSSGSWSCVPKNDAGSGNFSVSKQGDFYVCVSESGSSGTGNYNINGTQSTQSSSCGFSGYPSNQLGYGDFQIFASWEKFSPLGSFVLNDTSIQNSGASGNIAYSTSSSIKSYLSSEYNYDCSNGCVIPIIFNAAQSQNITLSGVNIKAIVDGIWQAFPKLYNPTIIPATFSTNGFQKISLNGANFTAQGNLGNHSFQLVFDNGVKKTTLASMKFSILNIPQISSIYPTITAALQPTDFTASVSGITNLTGYTWSWDFGDGSAVQTTTTNKITHTYNDVKIFNMTVNATNPSGTNISKKVQISVLAPKEAVNQILGQKLSNLNRLKGEINNVSSSFARDSLTKILNLNQTEKILTNLTAANKSAGASGASDQQYTTILKQLFSVNMPQSIQETKEAKSIQFITSNSSINLDALKSVGGGSYNASRESDYLNAITAWDLSNVQATVDYNEFSTIDGNSSQPFLDVVSVSVGPNPSGGNAYLIVPALDNMMLGGNYHQTSDGNYYYITLGNTPQTIQFATTRSLSPVGLPIFIAPALDQITLTPETTNNNLNNRILILALIIAGIFLVGFIIYVILGKWYQKRYESYLFKNKNDLYNVVNYIHSAKTRGVKNSEIERNLRRSSWTSEQISYVMKKYAGKGVGLPGFVKRMRRIKK